MFVINYKYTNNNKKSDRKISLKFVCFSVVDYGHRKDAVEIVFISY